MSSPMKFFVFCSSFSASPLFYLFDQDKRQLACFRRLVFLVFFGLLPFSPSFFAIFFLHKLFVLF